MKLLHHLMITSIVLLVVFPQILLASQSIDPIAACQFLSEQNFHGTLEYRQDRQPGAYNCTSLRKPIDRGEPLGSDLRYQVIGTAKKVMKIRLQLRMNSYRISTPVVREFHRDADIIYRKAFAQALPQEISDAILSATRGEWRLHGFLIKLSRIHDQASRYEMVFSIEK